MNASTENTRAGSEELAQVMSRLSNISENLLESYESLARRSAHVEEELVRTNDELAEKVAALDATTRHLEAVLQALPSGVVVRDEDGRVVRVNQAALGILECEQDELIGRRQHPGLLGSEALGEDREWARADGRMMVVSSRYSEIHSGEGEVTGSVEILDDRTQLVRLSERVHDMDKIAALGTMAAGIAHEIRNPMNAVRGFAELLKRHRQEGTRDHRWTLRITEGVDEIDAIITSMLTFADPERLQVETIDGAELLDEAIRTAQLSIPEGKSKQDWEITCNSTAPPFPGDRIKLRQALRNLIANAIDVQPDGGRIHAAIDLAPDSESEVGKPACGQIIVRVDDDGPGIPLELKHRVMDPFFTTRPEGTGLGLALVHTIAQLHGGSLEIASNPDADSGARAVIRIPFSPAT